MAGSRRARPGPLPGGAQPPGEGEGTPRRPRGTARDRALRLLAVRPRTRREVEDRLRRAGFGEEEVGEVVRGLTSAGLIDDEGLAREVAERALGVRLSGERAVRASLAARGVDRDTVDRVLGELAGDEESRANALAAARATRLSTLEPRVASRRLYLFLLRRGYPPSVAGPAARRALGMEAGAPGEEAGGPLRNRGASVAPGRPGA